MIYKVFFLLLFLSNLAMAQINVAVIDQGIDKNHPLFKDKIKTMTSVIENESSVEDETDGHGTHVAGIIIKQSKSNIHLHIIKNQSEKLLSSLRSVKNFDPSISRESWSANIPKAINEAIKNKVKIINFSQITYYSTPEMYEAFLLAQKHNILIVAASGNKDFDLSLIKKGYNKSDKSKPEVGSFPCSYQLPNIICVGNYVKNHQKRVAVSNYGKDIIDVWSYGNDIKSACVGGKEDCIMSGTSMSVPRIVSKLVELLENNPNESNIYNIKNKLLDTLKKDNNLIELSKNGKFLD